MRPDAHIDIISLLEEGEVGIRAQVTDMLHLVDLPALLHQADRLRLGKGEDLEGQVLLHDLLHLRFDRGQILIGKLHIAQVDIVVEALVRCRPIGEMRLRVEVLDRLRQDMRRAVAEHMQFFFRRRFGYRSVVVDDLHV